MLSITNNAESLDQESANSRSRIPRVRSSAYPSYTIDFCFEFTKKIHQNFGNSTFNQREEIAKVLKISVGHILTQLSSSSQYGLVDMKMKVGYKPSDIFLRAYKPMNDEEKREAFIDCLLNPELYKKLILQFQNGIVPSVPALSTILFRSHSIAEAASENAAQIFIDNLSSLNLLDNENHLLLDRKIDVDEIEQPKNSHKGENKEKHVKETNSYAKNFVDTAIKKVTDTIPEQPNTYPIIIPLKNSRVGKLILPTDFNNEDLDKVEKFIKALRE